MGQRAKSVLLNASSDSCTDEDGHVASPQVVVFVVDDARDAMLRRIDHDGFDLGEKRRRRGRRRLGF